MGLFSKKCPFCGHELTRTNAQFPYPKYKCKNCIRNNRRDAEIEELIRKVEMLTSKKPTGQ